MSDAYYYVGVRPDVSNVSHSIAVTLLNKLINDALPSGGYIANVFFKYGGPVKTTSAAIDAYRSGDDAVVAGVKFSIKSVLTADLTQIVSLAVARSLAAMLGEGVIAAIGVNIAPLGVAVGIALAWDALLKKPVGDEIDKLFNTEDAEFVLRSPSGDIIGGAFYNNGTDFNPISNASALAHMALVNPNMADPTYGSSIDYLVQDELVITYKVTSKNLLKAIGEAVGESEGAAANWGGGAMAKDGRSSIAR